MTDLDKTLDELVKERRTAQRQPRGGATRGAGASRGGATRSFRGRATTTRGGRGGRATTTTFGARNNNAGTPLGVRRTIQRNRPVATTPRHTAQPQAAPSGPRILSITTGGAKLIVRNLDAGVSTQDINDLFGDVGALKKAEVRFDRSGRSTGVAEVIYKNKNDATTAINRYHGVPLDGKPMHISFAATSGLNIVQTTSTRGRSNAASPAKTFTRGGRSNVGTTRTFTAARGGFGGRGRGGARGTGRGRGRGRRENLTQEQLDAELDQYQMQD
eukprot:TRINITY_DN905_c0_g1::TRINITY_DN905_c0_g1_i2::g.16013::m.16013 TRINITY_DN905_c0_g1::TRINITY_DN905_c0_g1_i2::g.16013  ORF type:complete len:281 (+),score=67.06,sp/Q9JJW6/ALRF2_MOUSE/33.09/4e-24,RRM_1/PF00076.17/1.6e-12,RRM_6/PF14259.1/2.9e-09,RRM_5/PF13893.1/5.6e-06,FoP_duplication/PF13865.1/5.2e+02,FoP_duplication/PF13865.1/1.8e+03,FoP_duplication/PF13865.1/4.5e-06 TRINITY_DN905_c0_g1_i2:27-845(+)